MLLAVTAVHSGVAAALWLTAAATSTDIDLLERAAQLSGPAVLLLGLWLLMTGRLRFAREVEREVAEKEAWKQAALERTNERELDATIAEAALAAGQRARRR